jgi:hypothetical protein
MTQVPAYRRSSSPLCLPAEPFRDAATRRFQSCCSARRPAAHCLTVQLSALPAPNSRPHRRFRPVPRPPAPLQRFSFLVPSPSRNGTFRNGQGRIESFETFPPNSAAAKIEALPLTPAGQGRSPMGLADYVQIDSLCWRGMARADKSNGAPLPRVWLPGNPENCYLSRRSRVILGNPGLCRRRAIDLCRLLAPFLALVDDRRIEREGNRHCVPGRPSPLSRGHGRNRLPRSARPTVEVELRRH